MRKTDKKIDNQLRIVLTDVCETALKEINGFQWLTHLVNYSNFPKSLKMVCVFGTNEQLAIFTSNSGKTSFTSLIEVKLDDIGIKFKNVADHILYDTEENCAKDHNGNWADRLG
ncbi:MAG: Fis family transcriptional regulator [Colwellia sp.]|nr:Fis family transcriptional regulator [Colwellia sp.]